jgi:predicted nucleic-acid-binding protein
MAGFAGSLDANVVLRLLLNDVADQHRSALKLVAGSSHQFAIADTAIIEVVFVLCRGYDFTREEASMAIEGIMRLREVNLNRSLFQQALPLFMKHPALSFEDCCLALYAQLNDATPLWTFDKKLARQAPTAELVG